MAESVIRVMCPNLLCRKILGVPPTARGKTVRCKACGTSIRIPEPPVDTVDTANVEAAEADSKSVQG